MSKMVKKNTTMTTLLCTFTTVQNARSDTKVSTIHRQQDQLQLGENNENGSHNFISVVTMKHITKEFYLQLPAAASDALNRYSPLSVLIFLQSAPGNPITNGFYDL